MKLIVVLHHVQTKVYGTVVMDNVFLHHTFVMVHLIYVLLVGDQTVVMVQMKV